MSIRASGGTMDARLVSPTAWNQFTDFANVFKAFIGTAFLSLPFAFKQSGLALGIVTLIVIAAVTDHCCHMMVKCKMMAVDLILESSQHYKQLQNDECIEEMKKLKEEVEQEMTFGDIGLIAIGKWGIRFVDVALVLTQTGVCVAYFIFIGNTLKDMFPMKYHPTANTTGNDSMLSIGINTAETLTNSTPLMPPSVGHHAAPPFVLLLLIPWPFMVLMSFVRYVRKLGPISGLANAAILTGFVGLVVHILQGLNFKMNEISQANWMTFPIFFGQVTFAFEGIGCIIPIESSMASNRPRFPLYLHITICLVSLLLGSFGVSGYLVYGANVPQIVTNTLSTGVFPQLIRVTMITAILFTYPLQIVPVIRITEGLIFGKRGRKKKSHLSELVAGHNACLNLRIEEDDDDDDDDDESLDYNSSNNMSEYPEHHITESTETDPLVSVQNNSEPFVYKKLTWKRNLIRTCLVTATAALALLLRDEFAYVNSFLGSMGSSVLAYVLPCIFHLVLFKNTNSGLIVVKDIVLILFGIIGGIVGVVITVKSIVHDFTHKQ